MNSHPTLNTQQGSVTTAFLRIYTRNTVIQEQPERRFTSLVVVVVVVVGGGGTEMEQNSAVEMNRRACVCACV